MKKKLSIIFNVLIVIFEIIGFIITLMNYGKIPIEYYTIDSNLIALLTSLIFIVYLLLNKDIPKYLHLLKYIATVGLTITFLVVLFILIPMYDFNYSLLLFQKEMFYLHALCPILCIITFIFFDKLDDYTLKDNIIAIIGTVLYGIIMIVLNIFNIIKGPYPFLMIHDQSVFISILWVVIILGGAYLIALFYRGVRSGKNEEKNKK